VPAGVTFVRRAGVPTASGGNLVLATVQGSSVGVAISHARVSAVGEVEVAFTGPTTAAGQVAFFIVN
jgi:hypothetical protein